MTRLILIFMLLIISAPLAAAEIQNIRMGSHPDKIRLVIDFTGQPDFSVQTGDNPNQLSVTLSKKEFFNRQSIQWQTPFSFVESNDIADNFMQLSFPLSAPHNILSAFVIEGAPNRLVVDMVKATTDNFAKNIGQSFGTLQLNLSKIETIHAVKKPVIIIDAGHGGRDSGAVSPSGILEKNIVLVIAKNFATYLNNTGRYTAKLTRDSISIYH